MGLQVLEEWCDLLGKLQAMELAWPVCWQTSPGQQVPPVEGPRSPLALQGPARPGRQVAVGCWPRSWWWPEPEEPRLWARGGTPAVQVPLAPPEVPLAPWAPRALRAWRLLAEPARQGAGPGLPPPQGLRLEQLVSCQHLPKPA